MSWTIAPVGRGSNLIYSQAGMPSLDLRFAETKSLNDFISSTNLITFTRASNATFVGSDGLIQTATTDVPRFDHNPATGESLGLLVEEQRVNLLLNSETLATQTVTVTAAARTLSFYGTGSVVLSGAHSATVNGTGAYPTRTTLTFTPSAGSLTLTVSGTVQYANLEAGAFATSWIPTTGSTATRSADVASITGSNFSSWYRQDEGTIFNRFSTTSATGSPLSIDAGLASDRLAFGMNGSNTLFRCRSIVGGVAQCDFNLTAAAFPSANSFAFSYKADDFAATVNAGALSTNTSGTVPSTNVLKVGRNVDGSFPLNGHIQRLTYWPTRLSNATLQTITQP